jgi:chemotaxis protein MotA
VDLASIIGILGAIGFVVMAMIQGGDIGMFINVPSILIVFCGSLFVVLSQ